MTVYPVLVYLVQMIQRDISRRSKNLFAIDSRDKRPIYKQIIDRIVLLVSTEVLLPGDKLPSIRSLAESLGVNPNTVSRAYTELEYKNIIETVPKQGSYVKANDVNTELMSRAKNEAEKFVSKYNQLGLSLETIKEIVEAVLENARD